MTMGGFHLLSGLVISSFIRNKKYKKAKWGIIWGSIFPDIDLIASIVIFLITGDLNSAGFVHRSWTHGFFAIGLIIMIGFIISLIREDKHIMLFFLMFAVGMVTHITYDLLDGYVALLAPFSFIRYSIIGIDFQTSIEDTYIKVWNAFDGMSDALFFYLPLWYWANHKANNTSEINFAKKLLILSVISIAYYGFLLGLAFTDISVEMHLILVYGYMGIINCSLSIIIVQIKMKETIQDFSFLKLKNS